MINSWWRFSKYKRLDRLIHWIRYNIPIVRNMSNILQIFSLKVMPPTKNDLKVATIFDLVKPSSALFVPGYNEEPWIRDFHK